MITIEKKKYFNQIILFINLIILTSTQVESFSFIVPKSNRDRYIRVSSKNNYQPPAYISTLWSKNNIGLDGKLVGLGILISSEKMIIHQASFNELDKSRRSSSLNRRENNKFKLNKYKQKKADYSLFSSSIQSNDIKHVEHNPKVIDVNKGGLNEDGEIMKQNDNLALTDRNLGGSKFNLVLISKTGREAPDPNISYNNKLNSNPPHKSLHKFENNLNEFGGKDCYLNMFAFNEIDESNDSVRKWSKIKLKEVDKSDCNNGRCTIEVAGESSVGLEICGGRAELGSPIYCGQKLTYLFEKSKTEESFGRDGCDRRFEAFHTAYMFKGRNFQ